MIKFKMQTKEDGQQPQEKPAEDNDAAGDADEKAAVSHAGCIIGSILIFFKPIG
jgi:hypothetical protein